MQPGRTRYRVRLRFTTWRLLALVACVALFLGLLRDLDDADLQAGPPWSAIACMVVFILLSAVVIITKIVEFGHQWRERRTGRGRDRLFLPGRGDVADTSPFQKGETAEADGRNPADA